jgi:hypothetical protein
LTVNKHGTGKKNKNEIEGKIERKINNVRSLK